MEGRGLDGYFGEQGLPAGIQECLERFHRRRVDYQPAVCSKMGLPRIMG